MICLQIQEMLIKNGKTKYWLTNKMGKVINPLAT